MGKRIIAITGPSGSGKTTLGNLLEQRNDIAVPRHCTTRQPRSDDRQGFYKHLQHEDYAAKVKNGEFLITSGDGPEVKKEYGNFYGVLRADCEEAWKRSDTILLYVSYKDLEQLIELNKQGIKVDIINLTFKDIENGVKDRITKDAARNHTSTDVHNRIASAAALEGKYGKAMERYATCRLYTDVLDIEETYQKACLTLGITPYGETKSSEEQHEEQPTTTPSHAAETTTDDKAEDVGTKSDDTDTMED